MPKLVGFKVSPLFQFAVDPNTPNYAGSDLIYARIY